MGDQLKSKPAFYEAVGVVIGDRSSRLSQIVFFLLCFVPVFSTTLFGAVRQVTWILHRLSRILILLLVP